MSLQFIVVFLQWCGKAVEDPKSGAPSVKRFAFIMVITFLLGATCGVTLIAAWSIWWAKMIDPTDIVKLLLSFIENMSFMLLTAVTTGYIGGIAIDSKKTPEKENG